MIQDRLEQKCCYPLKKGRYFIYDDNLKSEPRFVKEDEKWNLSLINKLELSIHFYQNDGCLMTQNNLKKCDWLCIDRMDIYFIEAKDVKLRNRYSARKDAKEKFEKTIQYYVGLYPDLNEMNLNVIMNFKSNSGLISTSIQSRKKYFKDKFDADYLETQILEFK